MCRFTDTHPASFTLVTRRDTTAQSSLLTASSSTAPAITIRRTSVRLFGCPHRTPTASEPALPGAQPQVGHSDSAWAWRSAPGAVPGGDRWVIGAGDTGLPPGAGADRAAQQLPTSTAAGETQPTPERGRLG